MSTSPPGIPIKKKRNSSSAYLSVSCGATQTGGRDNQNSHETKVLSLGVKKRKPIHYRRTELSKEQVKPIKTDTSAEAETCENQGETDETFDESIYSTICEYDTNKHNDDEEYVYFHPMSTTEDNGIEKRKENIKRWKVDREKKGRLLSTSSSASKQSFSDESSEGSIESGGTMQERDNKVDINSCGQAEAHMLPTKRKQQSLPRVSLISLLLVIVSVGFVCRFFLFLVFMIQGTSVNSSTEHGTYAESSVLSDVENIKQHLALHETQIENLKVQIEKKNEVITRLAMETANLKEKMEGFMSKDSTKDYASWYPDSD